MIVKASFGMVRVSAVVSSASEALMIARARNLSIVVVPGAAWLCSVKVAAKFEAAGYSVL